MITGLAEKVQVGILTAEGLAGLGRLAGLTISTATGTATKIVRTTAVSDAMVAKYSRQLAEVGKPSVLKSKASLEKRLVEHLEKLKNYRAAGGYTSSVEKEIANFKAELEAIDRVLNP